MTPDAGASAVEAGSDAEAIVRRFWYAMNARDWSALRALLDDEFVAELPVSNERFVGPEAFLAMNREYPGGWALTVIRTVGGGGRAASEVRARRDGTSETCLSFYELKDRRIIRAADWWPKPYEAPASRAALASPPPDADRRLEALDALDDARFELLQVVEALSSEALVRPLPGRTWRPLDVVNHVVAWDEAATDNVRALAAGRQPPGVGGDVDRFNETAVAARHDRTGDEALASLYRARADLRVALWEAPPEIWDAEPVVAADGGRVSLPRIRESWTGHDREHAAELRHAIGGS